MTKKKTLVRVDKIRLVVVQGDTEIYRVEVPIVAEKECSSSTYYCKELTALGIAKKKVLRVCPTYKFSTASRIDRKKKTHPDGTITRVRIYVYLYPVEVDISQWMIEPV